MVEAVRAARAGAVAEELAAAGAKTKVLFAFLALAFQRHSRTVCGRTEQLSAAGFEALRN